MDALLSALPFALLLLLCPLAMLFMMRGMHGGRSGHAQAGCRHDADGEHHGPADERLKALEAEVDELRRQASRQDDAPGPGATRRRDADVA